MLISIVKEAKNLNIYYTLLANINNPQNCFFFIISFTIKLFINFNKVLYRDFF